MCLRLVESAEQILDMMTDLMRYDISKSEIPACSHLFLPLSVLNNAGSITGNQMAQNYVPTEQEERYAEFAKVILAGTEDVWTEEFRKIGRTYEPPKMVLFTGSVNSGCGNATSAVGPFYCSADKTLYIDLSFFEQMEKQMGAGGDFGHSISLRLLLKIVIPYLGRGIQSFFNVSGFKTVEKPVVVICPYTGIIISLQFCPHAQLI